MSHRYYYSRAMNDDNHSILFLQVSPITKTSDQICKAAGLNLTCVTDSELYEGCADA